MLRDPIGQSISGFDRFLSCRALGGGSWQPGSCCQRSPPRMRCAGAGRAGWLRGHSERYTVHHIRHTTHTYKNNTPKKAFHTNNSHTCTTFVSYSIYRILSFLLSSPPLSFPMSSSSHPPTPLPYHVPKSEKWFGINRLKPPATNDVKNEELPIQMKLGEITVEMDGEGKWKLCT